MPDWDLSDRAADALTDCHSRTRTLRTAGRVCNSASNVLQLAAYGTDEFCTVELLDTADDLYGASAFLQRAADEPAVDYKSAELCDSAARTLATTARDLRGAAKRHPSASAFLLTAAELLRSARVRLQRISELLRASVR